MKITKAKNLKFSDENNATISADVFIDTLDAWVPFVMSSSDVELHGREAFNRAMAGEFGEISAYTLPVVTDDELAQQIRDVRDVKLAELDDIVSNPLRWAAFSDEIKSSLATYRQALLDVPQQTGFPTDIDWPESPIESTLLS